MIPVRQNILVKPYPSEEVSEGGIYVPENAREVSNKVKVVAVGTGTPKKPMLLKAGMTGFRVKSWGQPLEIDGELHFIMEQSAIIALQ